MGGNGTFCSGAGHFVSTLLAKVVAPKRFDVPEAVRRVQMAPPLQVAQYVDNARADLHAILSRVFR